MRIHKALATVLAAAGMLSASGTDLEAQVCDVSWVSAVSGVWTDGARWSTGAAPTPAQSVCIEAVGAAYTVTLNVNAPVAGFTLNSANATFLASGRTFTVDGPSALSDGLVFWVGSTWAGTGTLNNTTDMTFRGVSRINSTFQQNGNVQIQGTGAAHATLTVPTGFTNAGTITLNSIQNLRSATLRVTNGTLINTGTINTEVGSTGSRLITADLTNNGTVNLNAGTVFNRPNGVYTNNAVLNISSGTTLSMTGGGQRFVQNSGTLAVGGAFAISTAAFTFSGGTITGTATLFNAALNITATTAGSFLVRGNSSFSGNIAALQTVQVQGFGNAHATLTAANEFTNAGTITLNSIQNFRSATLRVTNGTLINTGTINTEVGSTGGRLIAADLTNNGTVNLNQTTTFQRNGGVYTNNSAFNIAAGKTLVISGASQAFEQAGGTLAIDGAFSMTAATFRFSGGTITGTATLFNAALNITATTAGSFLVRGTSSFSGNIAAAQTVQVQGFISANATLTAANEFTNAGTITLNSIQNFRSATLRVTNGTLINTGTINTEVGSTGPRLIAADLTNNGTVNLNQTTTFQRNGGVYTNNSAFNIAAGRTLVISGASQAFEQAGGTLAIDGAFSMTAATFRFNGGTITGTATLFNAALNITATTAGSFLVRGTSSFSGNIAAAQTVQVQGFISANATLTAANGFTNAGTITLNSIQNFRSATLRVTNGTLINTGTISAAQGTGGGRTIIANLINAGIFQVTSPNVTVVVTGSTFDNVAGGNVTGNGRVNVAGVSFTNNGNVSPGLSVGVLNLTGNYPQSSTGALNIEIGGTGFDVFSVSGNASLAGRLNVDLIDGFLPTLGQTFRVMNYGSRTGQFTEIVATAGGAELQGLSFVPTYNPNHVTLLVQGPVTFVVNSTADPGDGVCDTTECTLREAIDAANANPAKDLIAFDIPGIEPHTIQPKSALPPITGPVVIDGFTQPGAAPADRVIPAVLLIELDGSLAGPAVDGLSITAGNSAVRGLAINRFSGDGIELGGEGGNVVTGNHIGTNVVGTADAGNSLHGVNIDGSNNTVGGTAVDAGNIIAFNGDAGVFVAAGSGSANTGNAVLSNSIFSNSGIGIDLSPAGVTPNDAGDGDAGPNSLQNFPVLASADLIASTTIEGTLNSTPNTVFRLQFFSTASCHPSGFGEGSSFLAAAIVRTDGSGDANFSFTFTPTVPAGEFVAATATDPDNNTSEFSLCVEAVAPNTPAGNEVVTRPVDASSGTSPVELTFSTVTGPGTTSLLIRAEGPPPPTGFEAGAVPTYYELVTTALFPSAVTVCIEYDESSFDDESRLSLFQFVGNDWVAVTASLDTDANIICAEINSLGLFAIFGSSNRPPVADAGVDQTVECTAPGGTQVTLDGSGSTDPDANIATFEWFSGETLLATGQTATVTLPLGQHDIRLVVTDKQGLSDSDDLEVTVQDTEPPTLTILLEVVPELRGKFGAEEAAFRFLGVLAADACDADPTVEPVTLNGRALQLGDVVSLKLDDDRPDDEDNGRSKGKSKRKKKKKKKKKGGDEDEDDVLFPPRLRASAFILTATAQDASGNTTTVEAAVLLEDFAGADLDSDEVVPGTENQRGTPVDDDAREEFDKNLQKFRRKGFANPTGLPSAIVDGDTPTPSPASDVDAGTEGVPFDLSVAPDTLTVRLGESATYRVTLSRSGALSDEEVSFSCADLPVGISCAFSPTRISNGTAIITAQLTVFARAESNSLAPPTDQRAGIGGVGSLWSGIGHQRSEIGHRRLARGLAWIGFGALLLSIAALARRRRRASLRLSLSAGLLLVAVGLSSGCADQVTGPLDAEGEVAAEPGTHTFTVTAGTENVEVSETVTLIVR